jgi:glycosyltransferase involved in cell wall biosynthesis
VIINYPGWLADLVRDECCGWAAPPEQPEALADALTSAADDPGETGRRGAIARAVGGRMFARADLARRLVSVLEAVVRRAEPRRHHGDVHRSEG